MKNKKNINKLLRLTISLILIFTVLSVPLSSNVFAAEPGKTPRINSFSASSTNIKEGSSIILKWDIVNVTDIEIKGLTKTPEDKLPPVGELEVWPEESTTYVIIATNANGSASKSVSVNVNNEVKASIESFNSTATEVVEENSVILSWTTKNAKRIEIIGLEKIPEEGLPLNGNIEVWPTSTTTYILRAIGEKGDLVSQSITVNVIKKTPAKIESFKAVPASIVDGQKSTLSWKVSNAKSIRIVGLSDKLQSTGSIDVFPNKTTTYKLEAIGTDSKPITSEVTVTVTPKTLPKVLTFTASSYEISKGSLVTLKWTTENAQKCILITDNGKKIERPANGSISVTPNKTTTYTLVAVNEKEETSQKTITIVVNK